MKAATGVDEKKEDRVLDRAIINPLKCEIVTAEAGRRVQVVRMELEN